MNMSGDISSLPPTLSRTLTLHHHQHRIAEQLSADSFFCTFTQWICIFRTFCRKLCDVFSGNIACLHNMSRSRPVSKSTEVFLINSLPCWLNCRGLISLWHFYDKKNIKSNFAEFSSCNSGNKQFNSAFFLSSSSCRRSWERWWEWLWFFVSLKCSHNATPFFFACDILSSSFAPSNNMPHVCGGGSEGDARKFSAQK